MEQAQTFLAGPTGLYLTVGLALVAILFLVLWLMSGRKSAGGADTGNELRAAQNQIKLLRGDLMQANKELEGLKAVAGGKMPPEFEQYKRRAEEADAQIRKLQEAHAKEVEALKEMIPEDDSLGQTVIAPSTAGMHEEIERLGTELADARRQLDEAQASRQEALNELASKLAAEKAAALTAMEQRHAAAMEALKRQSGLGEAAVASALSAAQASAPTDAAALPYLEVVDGDQKGRKIALPFADATIGRSDQATIAIDEPRASRVHAHIRFDGEKFEIADNNSTNGTIVNGKPIATAPLAFGDVVGIGDMNFRFSCAAAEESGEEAQRLYRAMLQAAPRFEAAERALSGGSAPAASASASASPAAPSASSPAAPPRDTSSPGARAPDAASPDAPSVDSSPDSR
ncbi:MAG: FHA domain-containing protein [Geminicoccaceae bacterium]|nr:FHA domain-containing protein [Geminicoccaceae bacterium]